MKNLNKRLLKKVPVLTNVELIELGKIMYSKQNDELLKRRFWKEVYSRRGIVDGGIVYEN